jgi:hypothetical protein
MILPYGILRKAQGLRKASVPNIGSSPSTYHKDPTEKYFGQGIVRSRHKPGVLLSRQGRGLPVDGENP